MAKRTIVKVGDDVLRKISKKVTVFDDKLGMLLDDMNETMIANNGCGLAAVQVGLLKRVAVIDTDGKLFEIINPVIVKRSGSQIDKEGCLSIPNKNGYVERPDKIKVEAQNRKGEPVTIEAEGYLARTFCHEIDHLDGILYTDKIIPEDELDFEPED